MDYVEKVGRDYFEVVHTIFGILGIIATSIDAYTPYMLLGSV